MDFAWIHLSIYLALLRRHLGGVVRPCTARSLRFLLSVCTEPAQIRFYCIYLFISPYLFSISEASYQRPANLRSRVAGEPRLYICARVCVRACEGALVCARVSGDWYKIKIEIERKHWIHHFCYRRLFGLQLPLWTNSSRVMKQKTLKCTHCMTHTISSKQYYKHSARLLLQWVWKSYRHWMREELLQPPIKGSHRAV